MSVPHSTLTDRTPNILNKDPADKRPKNDKSPVSLKQEFDPTGLVQRCVIIQRDENGFGLTVSGDNPVFVQLVKEDGAAMRAGVQTGDRIIKVNGTLVTHSNHIEVVKLIKSGSYVALTVLGRPPGLQIPLEEEEGEREREEEGAEVGSPSSSSPAALPGPEPSSPWTSGTPPLPDGDENKTTHRQTADNLLKMLTRQRLDLQAKEEECSRSPRAKLLREIEEAKKQLSLLQEQLGRVSQDGGRVCGSGEAEEAAGGTPEREPTSACDGLPTNSSSVGITTDGGEAHDPDACRALIFVPDVGSGCSTVAVDCSMHSSPQLPESPGRGVTPCQSPDISRRDAPNSCSSPDADDNADALCFLYADMHKQTSSKESRRFFVEFHSLFMDRTANLKVPVPETIAAELEKRRLELIPEELCKQLTQTLQDSLLPDLHRNLDDFRQKRSMGLTLAEDELCKLDVERGKDQPALEKECSCAEHIISKIEDILLTSLPSEEEKCQTMQYVILTYMKHLGVKVKEPRGLEHKRPRINFLPKIKKSIKPEKEGEEKVKKPRFPNILGPPRRLSRVDSTSVGKAVELNKQRSPKQLPQPAPGIPEHSDPPASNPPSGRIRGSQLSEGSDGGGGGGAHVLPSPTHGSPAGQASDASGQDSDSNLSPFSVPPRPGEGPPCGEQQDAVFSAVGTQFDFSPSNLEQLQEEEQETFRCLQISVCNRMEAQCAASSADVQSEDDQAGEAEREEDPPNWQSLVSRDVLASLTPQEIKRQEVINGSHCVFLFLNIFPPSSTVSVTEQMTATRKRSETSVIGPIGDDLLAWFGGEEEEKIKRAVGTFCSNQPSALEFIKTKKKKDQRFYLFMREAESNRLCRRLQLKDIIPVEMQRLTKYPLLLDNIAKYTEDGDEREKVKKAGECCKKILNHVNQAVKEAENKQRLEDYQRRLDLSSLKQSENPMILELRNLDLTKRKMVHEGPLSWRVNKDKRIELYTILLEDILVLLQKQDERLVLKFHGKNPASAADTTNIFSPVIKLSTVLVRPVATHNKSFFVLSMSDNGAQIYELRAQTESDQRMWQCLITQCAEAMKAKPHNSDTPPAQSEREEEEEEEEEEEDEELNEAELEAFLDGQLADRLPFLQQEGSRQGLAVENQEHSAFVAASSKAEDALRTLATLKQALFNHMLSREAEEEPEETEENKLSGAPGGQQSDSVPEGPEEPPPPPPPPPPAAAWGFVVLDFSVGCDESSADDDGGLGGDVGIDMRKLLSSSSQTGGAGGGGGPDLSRQLMTHLRLLQADLQYLKEVELKYNELRQTHSDAATDSDDNNDGIQ
ncbi:putative rho guanine nucleotide exchange factor 12-like [Scophthalmus maximus]|uniref:Putative rho guanine nucleotide exchange factor 12-like n=1 Tax=Scophthalmus maximus TaxID=52904 RepID=A0A2U9B741_SCOMX|nr:putative rho guanine nucleotide exchange factor 12-like [Scophthalmus maximus]